MLLVWFLVLAPCLLVLGNVDFAADRQALLDLYQATNGPSWERRGNWTSDISMCHWHGVSCACTNDVCRVGELLLPSNDMNGTLPVSIGSLSELVTLNLNTNMLSGDVPTSIGQLTRLKYLDLGYCQNYGKPYSSFDGTLALFSSLTNLQYLVLNQNNFTGTIPPAFSAFTSLLYLDLSYNQLSGSVGSWIGQLPQLEWLILAGNLMSGSIPAEINLLQNVTVLDLSSNARLAGSLPTGFGLSLQTLTSLTLQYTRLSGSLPDTFCHIFSDPSTWRVPTNFPPQYLHQFWYRLKIDPRFPSSFFNSHAAFPQFEIYLFSAKMSGTLPSCLSRMRQLQNLHMSNNEFTGTIPSDLNQLENLLFIDFSNNMLNGTIPPSMGQLQLMTDLRLMGNELSGTLPAELQNATSLRFLDVSRNFITGIVPDSWTTLHKLKKMNIGYNRIQSLPQNMGEMSSLLQLIAPRNKLRALPTSLSKLSLLTVLDVSGNLISGNLNDYLSGSMVVVDVSKNRFGGVMELPSLQAQSSLQLIDIQRNQYSCPYPMFKPSIVVQATSCDPSFDAFLRQYSVLLWCLGAGVVVALIVFLFNRVTNSLSRETKQSAVYWAVWSLRIVLEVITIMSLWNMLSYLAVTQNLSEDKCRQINHYSLFSYALPASLDGLQAEQILQESWRILLQSDTEVPSGCDSQSLSSWRCIKWVIQHGWDLIPPYYVPQAEVAFRQLCELRIRSGCAYDPRAMECVFRYPDRATFGGTQFRRFAFFVWAMIVMRLVYELVALACVLYSYYRKSVEWHPRVPYFIRTSTFAPLLYCRLGRDYSPKLALYHSTHVDLLFWFVSRVILLDIPLQVLNVYFLARIAQFGLEISNFISIMKESIILLVLIVRIVWKWCRRVGKFGVRPHDRSVDMTMDGVSLADYPARFSISDQPLLLDEVQAVQNEEPANESVEFDFWQL